MKTHVPFMTSRYAQNNATKKIEFQVNMRKRASTHSRNHDMPKRRSTAYTKSSSHNPLLFPTQWSSHWTSKIALSKQLGELGLFPAANDDKAGESSSSWTFVLYR
jgi:hypothetical protein